MQHCQFKPTQNQDIFRVTFQVSIKTKGQSVQMFPVNPRVLKLLENVLHM